MVGSDRCPQLAYSGLDLSVTTVIAVAIACFAFGIAFLLVRRRSEHPRASIILFLVLLGCAVAAIAQPAPANAAAPRCGVAAQAFSITQTSIITGLAPGTPEVGINTIGTNTGSASTFVHMVVVSISSVTKAPLAIAGRCNATDYVVDAPRMMVDQAVAPGSSLDISGAAIGFNDRGTNQDACKGATVHLAYEVYQS